MPPKGVKRKAQPPPADEGEEVSFLTSHLFPDVVVWSSDLKTIPLTYSSSSFKFENDSFRSEEGGGGRACGGSGGGRAPSVDTTASVAMASAQ